MLKYFVFIAVFPFEIFYIFPFEFFIVLFHLPDFNISLTM